jgi:hypothetical protein
MSVFVNAVNWKGETWFYYQNSYKVLKLLYNVLKIAAALDLFIFSQYSIKLLYTR